MNQQQVEIMWEVLERTDPGNVGGPAIRVLHETGWKLYTDSEKMSWIALCDLAYEDGRPLTSDGIGKYTSAVVFFILLVLAAEGEL